MKHGFLKILTEEECKAVIKSVDELHPHWRKFQSDRFYTLGAAAYQEGYYEPEKYNEIAAKMNPILKENFGWVYERVIKKLSEQIGPCELIDPLAYPGFHILGHPLGEANTHIEMLLATRPISKIHVDGQFNYSEQRKMWSTFKNVENNIPMSWTLSIQMPKSGSCLATWDNDDMKQYEKNKKLVEYVKGIRDYAVFKEHRPPDHVVTYKTGELFFFHGLMKHQIGPTYKMDEYERRITMQGHGMLCDGVWRIYF